jgi:plasmid stabilization system protein ParE
MRIRWTAEASDQIIGIVQHIQQENPTAALNVAQAVIDDIDRLETFPHLWAARRVKRNPRTGLRALRRRVPRHK